MKFRLLIVVIFSLSLTLSAQKEKVVLIETSLGNIKVKLYDETPLHRDNFVKLANEHFFDSLLFHRVINEFMIQGGDPESKNATPGARLGNGGPGYKIPAEFNSMLYHKKGVLAAAREGDQVNPEKKSSGSQFYIVQGKVFTDSVLNLMEKSFSERNKQTAMNNYLMKPENKVHRENIMQMQKARDMQGARKYMTTLEAKVKDELEVLEPFKFTKEQRKMYTTVGGTPHLDASYTVFGEVIEGIEVVDKIALVKTDKDNRPLQDVIMKISLVK